MRSQKLFAFLVTLLFVTFIGTIVGLPFEVCLIGGLAVAYLGKYIKVPIGTLNGSLVATLTQKYRSQYSGRIDKNEQRQSVYGAWDLFKEQTASSTGLLGADDIEKLQNAWAIDTDIPVINYQDVSIGNVRTCAIQTGGPTSALMNVTFATFVFGFPMFPALYGNNDIKYQEIFNKNMTAYELKLASMLDSAAVAKLESARNSYFPASITGSYYANTGNALQVPAAAQDDFFNQLQSIMQTMDFYGRINDLTNPKGMAQIRRWAGQGQGNQTNLSFQFGGQDFKTSNRVVNNSGVASTHYIVAPDSLAVVRRLDPDTEMGSTVGGGQKKWEKEYLPIVGMDFGVYYNEDCTDASAIQALGSSRLTRTKIESYEFSADIAFVTPYNSRPSADFTPIIKAELLTT